MPEVLNLPETRLILMVGLPAAGKTTRAEELAASLKALRLTPDHWMNPLSATRWPTAGAGRSKAASSR